MIAAEGAWFNSLAVVPLYDTLGPDACAFIVNQASICTVLCDTAERAKHAVSIAKNASEGKASPLKRIILMEEISADLMAEAKEAGLEICSFEEVSYLAFLKSVETLDIYILHVYISVTTAICARDRDSVRIMRKVWSIQVFQRQNIKFNVQSPVSRRF